MKYMYKCLLGAIIIIAISCNNQQKEENIEGVISYLKIDSLLNTIEYERLDTVWMKSRAKVFKEKNIENDWAETGVIVSDLDLDSINDYVIISKNQFHPQNTEQYAIVAILGKSLKCYTIETYFLYEEEKFEGDTDFELPSVIMVKEENKNMIYFSKSRTVDCVAPKYYNKEKDAFEFANESPVEEQKEVSVSTNTVKIYILSTMLERYNNGLSKLLSGFVISKEGNRGCYFEYNGDELKGNKIERYAILRSNGIEPFTDFKLSGSNFSFSHRVYFFGDKEECPRFEFISGELADTINASITIKSNCETEEINRNNKWVLTEMPNINYDRIVGLKDYLLVKEESTNSEETVNVAIKDLMSINEIKLALLDAGKKKCDLLLGSPDRDDILYVGKENKLVRVYLNKVIDSDGKTKHLILFLRDNYKQKIFVEDIKAINDGEKAYFGIHYVEVNKGVVTSNSHHFGIGK